MSNLFLVALFGAIGSLSRFVLIQATPKLIYLNFLIGTILVNLIGFFFIGVVASLFEKLGQKPSYDIKPKPNFFSGSEFVPPKLSNVSEFS